MFLSLSKPMLPTEWNGLVDCGSLKLMMSTGVGQRLAHREAGHLRRSRGGAVRGVQELVGLVVGIEGDGDQPAVLLGEDVGHGVAADQRRGVALDPEVVDARRLLGDEDLVRRAGHELDLGQPGRALARADRVDVAGDLERLERQPQHSRPWGPAWPCTGRPAPKDRRALPEAVRPPPSSPMGRLNQRERPPAIPPPRFQPSRRCAPPDPAALPPPAPPDVPPPVVPACVPPAPAVAPAPPRPPFPPVFEGEGSGLEGPTPAARTTSDESDTQEQGKAVARKHGIAVRLHLPLEGRKQSRRGRTA